ncbi:hypothetical protein [Acidithiobacillus ferrivorans]|uniref:hypothetical protein n=1 Tax=Acidithiobacillus ferrivorans TaxID=160808 RepID=UPI00159EE369|nr:hypothetical protein [Acidithiobacillus ferrivorans]
MTKPLTPEQKEYRQKFRRRVRIEAHRIKIQVQVRRMLKERNARELHDIHGQQGE